MVYRKAPFRKSDGKDEVILPYTQKNRNSKLAKACCFLCYCDRMKAINLNL